MAITFEQFFQSIIAQESGGNYGAIGQPTRFGTAYGKYQVLDSNIPGWTKAYYGKSLTPSQFLANHAAQDAVARGKLKSYFNKYGPRGAAAAWYGGEGSVHLHNSTKSQQGGPSIKEYVDSVVSRAEGLSVGDSTTATASTSGGGVMPKLSMSELAEQYGFTSAMLNAIPELKSLFQQMVSEDWGASEGGKAKFQAKLRNTKWFKTLSSSERQFITLRYTDPATAKQKQEQAMVKVTQMAKQLGLTGKYATNDFLKSYAYNMVAKGWDEGRIRFDLARFLNPSLKSHTGEAGQAWDEIDNYAYGMGVKLSEGWIKSRAINIARGTGSIQDVKGEIANLAKAQFPQWSKQIDGGQSVADIAMPYMQSMSQILELAPGSINLFDPTIKKTLSWTNPSTNKKEAKPMWQFENELRNDPRWKRTDNAQDSLMQVAHQVLADFGMRY